MCVPVTRTPTCRKIDSCAGVCLMKPWKLFCCLLLAVLSASCHAPPPTGSGDIALSNAEARHVSSRVAVSEETIEVLDVDPSQDTWLSVPGSMAYPYPRHDGKTVEKHRRTLRVTVLENEYLRLEILPAVGARLYRVVHKPSGKDLFSTHTQQILRTYSLSGGYSQGYHRPFGAMKFGFAEFGHIETDRLPFDCRTEQRDDGSAVFEGQITERQYGMSMRVTYALAPGEMRFRIGIQLANPADGKRRGYDYWQAANFNPHSGVEFHLPTDTTVSHDEVMPWPIVGEKDWRIYDNFHSDGLFIRQARRGDAGVYDHLNALGVARIFPPDIVKGVKVWTPEEWGKNSDEFCLDFQAGVARTQDTRSELDPGQTVAWEETWFPAPDLGGLDAATDELAFAVRRLPSEELQVRVMACVSQDLQNRSLSVERGGHTLLRTKIPAIEIGRAVALRPFHDKQDGGPLVLTCGQVSFTLTEPILPAESHTNFWIKDLPAARQEYAVRMEREALERDKAVAAAPAEDSPAETAGAPRQDEKEPAFSVVGRIGRPPRFQMKYPLDVLDLPEGGYLVSDEWGIGRFDEDFSDGKSFIRSGHGEADVFRPLTILRLKDGTLLVADTNHGCLKRFTADGGLIEILGRGVLKRPTDVVVVQQNGVTSYWVTDGEADCVWRVEVGTGETTMVAGGLGAPFGLLWLPERRSALVSDTTHDRLVLVDDTGTITPLELPQLGLPGKMARVGQKIHVINGWSGMVKVLDAETLALQFEYGGRFREAGAALPASIRLAADGSLLVPDAARVCIERFDADGRGAGRLGYRQVAFINDKPSFGSRSFARIPGGYVTTSGYGGRVFSFDSSGRPLRTAGVWGRGYGCLGSCPSVASDSRWRIFLPDFEGNRVYVIDTEGVILNVLGARGYSIAGDGPGEFWGPRTVDIGADDALYVADYFNGRIQVFDKDGAFVRELREEGNPDFYPRSAKVDEAGNVYAVDGRAWRAVIFRPDGSVASRCDLPFPEALPAVVLPAGEDALWVGCQRYWTDENEERHGGLVKISRAGKILMHSERDLHVADMGLDMDGSFLVTGGWGKTVIRLSSDGLEQLETLPCEPALLEEDPNILSQIVQLAVNLFASGGPELLVHEFRDDELWIVRVDGTVLLHEKIDYSGNFVGDRDGTIYSFDWRDKMYQPVDHTTGKRLEGGAFSFPARTNCQPWVIDSEDNYFVPNWPACRVDVYDSGRQYLRSFGQVGDGGLEHIGRVWLDSAGNAFAGGQPSGRIAVYDPAGHLVRTLGGPEGAGDTKDRIFSYNNWRLMFAPFSDGSFLGRSGNTEWQLYSAKGEFLHPNPLGAHYADLVVMNDEVFAWDRLGRQVHRLRRCKR